MKRILMIVAGVMASTLTVSAETVTQALVTGWQGNVYVCNIDESDNWTLDRTLAAKSGSGPLYKASHAIYKNGIVYVSDAPTDGGVLGYVHKYKLDGSYLGKIDIPGSPEGLAITPDGTTLFVGEFKGSDGTKETHGRIFKVNVATEEVTLFCNLNDSSSGIRDLEIDDAGHLYAADRGKSKLHIFSYAAAENPNVPVSKSFNFCEAVAYNPADQYVYVAGNDAEWGVFDRDGNVITEKQTAKTSTQWCVGATAIDGDVFFASYGAYAIFRLDPVNNDFTNVFAIGSSTRLSGVAEIVRDDFARQTWAFDEANGKATAGSEDSDVRFSFYDGVRMSTSGVRNNCAVLADATSRLVTDGSASLVPATGDFAVFFWVGGLSGLVTGGSFPVFSNGGTTGNFSLVEVI